MCYGSLSKPPAPFNFNFSYSVDVSLTYTQLHFYYSITYYCHIVRHCGLAYICKRPQKHKIKHRLLFHSCAMSWAT